MLATIQSLIAPLLAAPLVESGSIPWLTIVTFAPLLGAFALMFVPAQQKGVHRNTALFVSLGTFVMSLAILFGFDAATPAVAGAPFTFQMVEGPVPWVDAVGISYMLGIDGISLWLVILTTFLMPIAIFATYDDVNKHVKEYMICLLFLETGMIGALVSLDVFLFYVFWEMMLIPMYLIIGVWGSEDRIYAAVKFFLYTMVGSLLMLISILYVYFQTGGDAGYSFLFTDMLAVELSYPEQFWLFGAFFLAFAIKVPLFPFHTWLPLAHVQAPTAGSVILAGVLLKMGTYGLLRYAFPLFPDAVKTYAPYIATLAVIGIVYGAIVAMVQPNVKKLVAYSSVSHLGFCVLGLIAMTPMGVAGGIYIMLAHGIATGGLFLCVGILYERRHTKMIEDFGGIAKTMPLFAVTFMIIVFASVGLPGLNGFVGEFLSLIGTARSQFLWFDAPYVVQIFPAEGVYELTKVDFFPLPDEQQAGPEFTALIFASIAALGVIFAAGYLLWMFRRVMFGPLTNPKNENLEDLNGREIAYLVPIVAMCIFMGVYPKFFLGRVEPAVHQFLQYMDANVTATGTVVVERAGGEWIPEGKMLDPKLEEDAEVEQ